MIWYVETVQILKVPWCVGSVVYGDFKNVEISPGVCALWCMETLKIYNVPGLWALWCVVCGDFMNIQSSLMRGALWSGLWGC